MAGTHTDGVADEVHPLPVYNRSPLCAVAHRAIHFDQSSRRGRIFAWRRTLRDRLR
jgi:hypothetical protein